MYSMRRLHSFRPAAAAASSPLSPSLPLPLAPQRVWKSQFLGRPTIIKQRFKKAYRHPALDTKLTKARLNSEVRHMARARKLGVLTPVVRHVDQEAFAITMEHVDGTSVKEILFQTLMTDEGE
jgi:TP53 regulating kinase and related kinases